MDDLILKLQTEKLPIGTSSDINKLSSNSIWIFKSHFEQFITTQPGMTDLLNHICQNLTYSDSRSVKNVTKDFQVWISNSEVFRLGCEADAIIDKVIATINDECFREHFRIVLRDVYKNMIGNCKADMLEVFIEIMNDYYLEDVVDMTLSVEREMDEVLFFYGNFMMDLCFSFEIMALFVGFRFMQMGVEDVEKISPLTIIKNIKGTYSSVLNRRVGRNRCAGGKILTKH